MDFLILMLRMTRSAVIAAFCLAAAPGAAVAADGDSLEYAVKAAYLYKFGIYVEWPATAFAAPTAALNLCIVGDDPFGAVLDSAVSGQRVDTHPVLVRRLKTIARDSGCHILYLGVADGARAAQLQEAVRGSHVLTVGDTKVGGGGIVTFVVKDNRVRFTVDEEAAAQNGLLISSKLLSLALSVKPRLVKEGR